MKNFLIMFRRAMSRVTATTWPGAVLIAASEIDSDQVVLPRGPPSDPKLVTAGTAELGIGK